MEDLVRALTLALRDMVQGVADWPQVVEEVERRLGRRLTDEEHSVMYRAWWHTEGAPVGVLPSTPFAQRVENLAIRMRQHGDRLEVKEGS